MGKPSASLVVKEEVPYYLDRCCLIQVAKGVCWPTVMFAALVSGSVSTCRAASTFMKHWFGNDTMDRGNETDDNAH